jgi:hypothetical protein
VRLRKGWIPADPVAQHLGGSGVAARHSVSESHSDVHMPNPVSEAAVPAQQEASRGRRFDAIRPPIQEISRDLA